ncbi:general secretion pathway protein D [Methylocaldum marinum]|uniref:General secretion pathway protein D n=1 Tax=Methylocaldum marinum TaxID=1432792 RepID=A0A250KY41_9GAMM|nr:type II secretion system secretin GspD [Methylocaldum marinum]BBA36502.1 general secretion pathway protein D [Methylocaldum marinum]
MTKQPLPANLAIDTHKTEGEPAPIQTEPLEAQAVRPPEFYPATGNLIAPGARAEKVPSKEGKYTLNFDDADLGEVAKVILGDMLRVNYVLSPKVAGKVSLQTARPLSDAELVPTLEMLLKINGAVLIKEKGLYRIEPEATAAINAPGARLGIAGQSIPAGYQLRVVPLRYVGAQEMQKVIEPMMPPKSVIRADEARNILVLAGTGEELEGVLDTIRLFDVDFMRGMSVGLYPLRNVEPATIAEELDKVFGDTTKGPLAGVVRLLPIERLNAILAVTPQPSYLDEVEMWVERLDRYSTTRVGGIHVYRVQNVDAVELAETLSGIFGEGRAQQRRGPSLSPGMAGTEIGGFGAADGGFGDQNGTSFGGTGTSRSGRGLGSTTGNDRFGGTSTSSTRQTGGLGTGTGLGSGTGTGIGTGTGLGTGARGRGISSGRQARGATVAEVGGMRIVADASNNALIIIAKAQEYKEIEAVIKELDRVPLQVLIDASIVELTLTGQLQYGLQWLFNQGSGAYAQGSTTPGAAELTSNALTTAAAATGGGFAYAFVNSARDIRILLRALASENKVNVLSSPSLMVLNNQEATIKVGDQVPIQTSQSTPLTGGGVPISTATIQYRDTGVLLNIRPRVNAGGLVTLDIEQAVDNLSDQTVTGISSPVIFQRQIKSSVTVKDDDTIVLGGLISDRTTKNKSGIPFLYKLPVIGSLFGTTTTSQTRTELVVLLTPRVVHDRAKSSEITNEFRRRLTGLYEEKPRPVGSPR